MLRAIRAEKSVGRPSASSSEFEWSDCVWPWVAAIASTQVRITLLYGSWAASDQPEVWQWVRSDIERGSFGSNWRISRDQSRRPARIFATSMKKFIPIAQKKESRGANSSTSCPAASEAFTYSIPSARV